MIVYCNACYGRALSDEREPVDDRLVPDAGNGTTPVRNSTAESYELAGAHRMSLNRNE